MSPRRHTPRINLCWRHPLASWAAAESRREQDRDAANTMALCFCICPGMLLAVLVAVLVTDLENGTLSPVSAGGRARFILGMLWASVIPFLACWIVVPRVIRWRINRPARIPADELRARRGKAVVGPAVGVLAWAALVVCTTLLLDGVVVFMLFVLGNILAAWLILSGLRRRVGRDERCAHCAYPAAGPRWSRGPCPECGADLDRPWAVVLGRDTRSPARIALGVLTVAAAAAMLALRR